MIDHNWEGSCPAPLSEMHPKSILQIGYFYFPNRKTSGRNITISQVLTRIYLQNVLDRRYHHYRTTLGFSIMRGRPAGFYLNIVAWQVLKKIINIFFS